MNFLLIANLRLLPFEVLRLGHSLPSMTRSVGIDDFRALA